LTRDEAYIEAFCEAPQSGKQAALLKASYKGHYPAQEAYRIHKRLQKRLDKRLDEIINEGSVLGYCVLKKLATTAQSETVQARCAEALMNYAGRKPGERVTIKNEPETLEDINKKIKEVVSRMRKRGVDVDELIGNYVND